ncbi:MAG: radical SAM protein [Thermodesulfobacteriota bacterium]
MTRPGEKGAVRKSWGSRLPIALVYPNVYRVGMGNLGFQFLYRCLNSCESLVAERVFLPEPDRGEEARLLQPVSEESARPLSRFPVIAFSIPFENDYPAVPKMLMSAGIPPLQQDRGPANPLIIAGGISVSMNPEPLARFLDLVYVGEVLDEDEGSLMGLLADLGLSLIDRTRERKALLRDFRDLPGVYVPSCYSCAHEGPEFAPAERFAREGKARTARGRTSEEPAGRARGAEQTGTESAIRALDQPPESATVRTVSAESDLAGSSLQANRTRPCCPQPSEGFPSQIRAVKRPAIGSDVPVSALFSGDAEFGESLLVETNRGCSRRCRFCASGWIHFPVRYRRFDAFRAFVEKAISEGRTVGLIGSDLAGHPELTRILEHIVGQGGRFSLSSIRPEGLTPRVIELLAATGQKTATLAPEVASPRMKKVLGKEIPSERFLELVAQLVSAGIPHIRFYFMVGLPTETDEDAAAIADFAIKSRGVFVEASRPKGRIGSIGVQVNPFVPKPWTPFQWAPMARPEVLDRRIRIIRERLKRVPNVKVRVESVREALLQAFLARGDRRVADVLLDVARGASNPLAVCKTHGLDPELHLYRERGEHEPFPWDLIDHGISKASLWKTYKKSVDNG